MNSVLSSVNEQRIKVLDGFRCIAVISVILFHYFYRFSELPEFSDFPVWPFMKYGYFGVQLFFMISGFVIYRSLDQSSGAKDFMIKRYLRLIPTLVLCSIVTYAMVEWWNESGRLAFFQIESPLSFLFSFTLIHPGIWNTLLGTSNITYIDVAYWSLWTEVIFYISANILYFASRKENFLRNWFILVFVLNILRVASSPKLAPFTPGFLMPLSEIYYRTFLFTDITQWVYFSVGMLFYSLWTRHWPTSLTWMMAAAIFFLEMIFIQKTGVRILFIAAIVLWILFLLRPHWLSFFKWKPLQIVGLVSYPLYLLHETAGFVFVEKLIGWTNGSVPVAVLWIIVLGVFILLSYFVFLFFEKPVTRALKRRLLDIK